MIITIAVAVVASALGYLNFTGALDLTGSIALALVLGCVATVQWAAARQAMVTLSSNPQRLGAWRRSFQVLGLLLLYLLAAAWITVPLSAAKLDHTLGVAEELQASRFAEEQTRLRQRAKELGDAYTDIAGRLAQFESHAQAMRDLEGAKGGSCLTNRGDKPGEIFNFREQERRLAGELVARTRDPLAKASALAESVASMRLGARLAVKDAERSLGSAVDDLNQLSRAPALTTLKDFVKAADDAGRDIRLIRSGRPTESFACFDAQRTAALASMLKTVENVQGLRPLVPPVLMDASAPKEGAKARLIGAWSTIVGLFGKATVDPALEKKYRLAEGYTLSTSRVSWGLAWALEALLLGLVWLKVNDPNRSSTLRRMSTELGAIRVRRLAEQPSGLGRTAADLLAAYRHATPAEVVDGQRITMPAAPEFTAGAHRWQSLYPYLLSAGPNHDLLVIPSGHGKALAIARQAALEKLAQPQVQGISGGDLTRHPQIRCSSRFAEQLPADARVTFSVWRITNPDLVGYLLECWRNDPETP